MQGDFLEILRQRRESAQTAYSRFMLKFTNSPDVIYCFYEGENDHHYYNIRVRENSQCRVEDIICGAKASVLEAYDLIKSFEQYQSSKFGYFVDRDFDPLISNPEIYETPVHSIENFYTGSESVANIFARLFRIEKESDDFDKCIQLYNELSFKFHKSVSPLNAWLNCYIDIKHSIGLKKPVPMRDLLKNLFTDVVSTDLLEIRLEKPINNFDQLQVFFDNDLDVLINAFEVKLDGYAAVDPFKSFKGKFEIEFLCSFLHRLKHKLERRDNTLTSQRYVCDYHFNTATVLGVLSNYAHTPDCLRLYIRNIAA